MPATTFGDWCDSERCQLGPVGYGICTMTYGLVFDDNSDVWGGSPAEEAKARTVKDYWEIIVSEPAQAGSVPENDYAPLPGRHPGDRQAGVASVNWDKAPLAAVAAAAVAVVAARGGGGGGALRRPTAEQPVHPAAQIDLVQNRAARPSRSSSRARAKSSWSVRPKSAKNRSKSAAPFSTRAKRARSRCQLKPSAAAKKQLREKGSLQVSLELTFTPTGGDAKTSTSSIVLKLKQKGNSG